MARGAVLLRDVLDLGAVLLGLRFDRGAVFPVGGFLRAGIAVVFVLGQGQADGEAHLVAVHDDGGVVAQAELRGGQLDAQMMPYWNSPTHSIPSE